MILTVEIVLRESRCERCGSKLKTGESRLVSVNWQKINRRVVKLCKKCGEELIDIHIKDLETTRKTLKKFTPLPKHKYSRRPNDEDTGVPGSAEVE